MFPSFAVMRGTLSSVAFVLCFHSGALAQDDLLNSAIYTDELFGASSASSAIQQATAGSAVKPEKKTDTSAVLEADTFDYDQEKQVFTASGNVLLSQNGQIVTADQMVYDAGQDTVHAIGNVVFTDKNKQTYFADEVRLEEGMKKGVVAQVGLMFADGGRLAGRVGVKEGENILVLRDGLYSPCNLCKENPKKAPMWQLSAKKVVHDKEAQDVYYHNVTMDAYGVPVAYVPYFSHPDPDVVARSGLLMSKFSNDSKKGMMLRNYYYQHISPYEDVTLEVSPTTKGGTVFGTNYRKNFQQGSLNFEGSLNRSAVRGGSNDNVIIKPEKWRGHVFASGNYILDNNWSTGAVIRRTFDNYYLRDYDFGRANILTSQVYLNHRKDRDFTNIRAMYFQDLRPSSYSQDQSDILPWVKNSMYGTPNEMLGGRWNVNNEFVTLFRNGQQSVSKLSTIPSWERRDILPMGFQSTVNTKLRADGYWVRQQSPFDTTLMDPDMDRVESRFIPSANAVLGYPLVRPSGDITALVEPKVGISIAPNNVNDANIPNEDSRDAQIDISNLFSSNRFPGNDLYENGTHVSYGMKMGGYHNSNGNSLFVTLGQSYRLSSNNPFPQGSGLENDRSDYVGQIETTISNKYYMDYRFQLNQHNFDSRRHELQAAYMDDGFEARTNYVFAEQVSGTGLGKDRQQLGFSGAKSITKKWAVSVDTLHDLSGDAGMLKAGFGVQYKNECLRMSLRTERDLTDRVTGGSDSRVMFSLGLRNLGGYDTPLLENDRLYQPFGTSNRI